METQLHVFAPQNPLLLHGCYSDRRAALWANGVDAVLADPNSLNFRDPRPRESASWAFSLDGVPSD